MPPADENLCPICGYHLQVNFSSCSMCGTDIAWAHQQRVATMRVINRLGLALMACVPLSAAIIVPTGLLASYPKLFGPLWIAAAALGIALWMIAKNMRTTLDNRS